MFKKRAAELPFAAHPYAGLLTALEKLGRTGWDNDEDREQALNAMSVWVVGVLGNCVAGTLNEVVTLMSIARDGDDKAQQAAKDMASSMDFLEKISTTFLNSVDIGHVSEVLFEDGRRREAEEQNNQEKPAPEPKPKPEIKQVQNWTPTRWNPSMN